MCGTGNPLHHKHCVTCESKLPEIQMVRLLASIVLELIKSKNNIIFLWKTEIISLCAYVTKAENPSPMAYSSPVLPQKLHHKSPAKHKCIIYIQVSPVEVSIANAIVKAQEALRK